jgi:hypothetical protein
MISHKPGSHRLPGFRVESLEDRWLLSTLVPKTVPTEIRSASHMLPLEGKFTGTGGPVGPPIPVAPNQVQLPVAFTGTGEISHLGRTTIAASQTDTFVIENGVPVSETVSDGVATLTAANGDVLKITYHGTGGPISPSSTLTKVTLIFTIDGKDSTGRFAGATGSGVIVSTDVPGPNHPFVAQLEGIISSVGSNR